MMQQFTPIGENRQRSLKKIYKKHKRKIPLTLQHVEFMRDTPLIPEVFQRHARQFYSTNLLGNRLYLYSPFTDIQGRYIKAVILDFCIYKSTGYVKVQPFKPRPESNYGTVKVNFTLLLNVRSHKHLYRKLLEHRLLLWNLKKR